MSRPTVLVAHERSAVRQIVGHVLSQEGFDPTPAADADAVLAALRDRPWAGLVLDVALPGTPAFELCDRARALRDAGLGARAIVLVASVYRSTSYKRRPTRLYGADDYVEIHHLGDALPTKLRRALGLDGTTSDGTGANMHLDAGEALREICDGRMGEFADADLAKLIVADVVLYNGDRILETADAVSAELALAPDLQAARELFTHVSRGGGAAGSDPIRHAFRELMVALGRPEVHP
jgi:DNA-binding response OmpR family regulator